MPDDKSEILQKIIDHLGDCDLFTTPDICKRCPLGNKRVNGRRVNCMDYLKVNEEMNHDQICDVYLDAAEKELCDVEFEKMLNSEDEDT